MPNTFKVPASIGTFAALDDNTEMLAKEYGIPAEVPNPSAKFFEYPAWARRNVLNRIIDCAKALRIGSDVDTMREAGRILTWAEKQSCDCEPDRGSKGQRYHKPTCDYIALGRSDYRPDAQPKGAN